MTQMLCLPSEHHDGRDGFCRAGALEGALHPHQGGGISLQPQGFPKGLSERTKSHVTYNIKAQNEHQTLKK
jgi:hypothetical protein